MGTKNVLKDEKQRALSAQGQKLYKKIILSPPDKEGSVSIDLGYWKNRRIKTDNCQGKHTAAYCLILGGLESRITDRTPNELMMELFGHPTGPFVSGSNKLRVHQGSIHDDLLTLYLICAQLPQKLLVTQTNSKGITNNNRVQGNFYINEAHDLHRKLASLYNVLVYSDPECAIDTTVYAKITDFATAKREDPLILYQNMSAQERAESESWGLYFFGRPAGIEHVVRFQILFKDYLRYYISALQMLPFSRVPWESGDKKKGDGKGESWKALEEIVNEMKEVTRCSVSGKDSSLFRQSVVNAFSKLFDCEAISRLLMQKSASYGSYSTGHLELLKEDQRIAVLSYQLALFFSTVKGLAHKLKTCPDDILACFHFDENNGRRDSPLGVIVDMLLSPDSTVSRTQRLDHCEHLGRLALGKANRARSELDIPRWLNDGAAYAI